MDDLEMFSTLPLSCNGRKIDTSSSAFGWLQDSSAMSDDVGGLRKRMEDDGYLYLPGFLNVDDIRAAREAVLQLLSNEGTLDPRFKKDEAYAIGIANMRLRLDIANKTAAQPFLERILSSEKIIQFYSDLLGGQAKRYKCIWLRTMTTNNGAAPHCDIVFFGRGTRQLYTAWIPLGSIPLSLGGLFLLEGWHKNKQLLDTYCSMDIDVVCLNKDNKPQMNVAGYVGTGTLSLDTAKLQRELSCRLLTAKEYKMGDFLTFTAYTIHGSFDNMRSEMRLSVDTRYQLESEPTDERYLTDLPLPRTMKSIIC